MNKNITFKEVPKILVVDDREPERIILSKLLSKFNVEVHTVDSGQAALSKLIRHRYVLVLLDIQMPIMDGMETATIMRSNVLTENIPIIFLTAYDKDEITMLQGYKIGAFDFLFKPINEEILSSKVSTFLRSYAFEKEKEYEKILSELENNNQKLNRAKEEALLMMEDANRAKVEAQMSQKQVEEQAHELLRYNKELEQFAYVATHDLRTPIINLNALITIFKKKGFVTKNNKDVFKRIDGSVTRINTTLEDLIQVIGYRKTLQDDVKELVFEKLIKDIEKDLEMQMEEVGAKIVFSINEAPKIHYIPGHLRSILLNLITNAIKYRSKERNPIISLTTKRENNYICLEVKDNGIGIDENKKEKVFGLFQRLSKNESGKGIGLYIAKSLVESMGGSIDFDSQLDVGTEFRVFLKDLSTNKDKT